MAKRYSNRFKTKEDRDWHTRTQYEAIHKTKYEEMNNWIKIEDRLPKQGDVVMVYNNVKSEDHRVMVSWYDAKCNKFRDWIEEHALSERDNDSFFNAITHWQPLPEAPNKEEQKSNSVLPNITHRRESLEAFARWLYMEKGHLETTDDESLIDEFLASNDG